MKTTTKNQYRKAEQKTYGKSVVEKGGGGAEVREEGRARARKRNRDRETKRKETEKEWEREKTSVLYKGFTVCVQLQ